MATGWCPSLTWTSGSVGGHALASPSDRATTGTSSTRPRHGGTVAGSILRLVHRTSTVDPDMVPAECPGADLRDVERAVQLLVQRDMIVVPAGTTRFAGNIVGVGLTE